MEYSFPIDQELTFIEGGKVLLSYRWQTWEYIFDVGHDLYEFCSFLFCVLLAMRHEDFLRGSTNHSSQCISALKTGSEVYSQTIIIIGCMAAMVGAILGPE